MARKPTDKQLFKMKNEWLGQFYEEVKPKDFYRAVFPEGSFEREGHPEDEKCNGILTVIEGEKARNYIVFDELNMVDEVKGAEFTKRDVLDAMNMYQENYVTYSRAEVERVSGISVPQNKRNGRKQEQHIKIMNAIRDIEHPDGEWRNKEGRPKGSSQQKKLVEKWQKSHPDGKKADCIRDTGLSKPTVYKWWQTVGKETDLVEKRQGAEWYENNKTDC